jgi:saccharopine dehydrogenase (NADP+, L-glutamate forming)
MVVMQHEIEYTSKGKSSTLCSTMVIKGEDRAHSAMSKTVGLPMAILARAILRGKIKPVPGVHIPTMPSVYRPVLTELRHHGIDFRETVC